MAIALPGIAFDRRLKDIKYLYAELSERQFREFKKNKDLLSASELRVLQEIADIKEKERKTLIGALNGKGNYQNHNREESC